MPAADQPLVTDPADAVPVTIAGVGPAV